MHEKIITILVDRTEAIARFHLISELKFDLLTHPGLSASELIDLYEDKVKDDYYRVLQDVKLMEPKDAK